MGQRAARFLMGAILIVLISAPLWAEPSSSGPEAARRLEAQVLADNLLDFAKRSGSARAYLMAAELRLLYPPTGELEVSPDIRPLLKQALALAPGEPSVKAWAGQLDRLVEPRRRSLTEH